MANSWYQAIARWNQPVDEEAELIAEAQRDPAAFSSLYDRYVQPIYRYFYYRTSSAAEAEDLTSQTFLCALEALPRYRHQGNFAAWLFRIARGKVIDAVRKQKRLLPLTETFPAETGDLLAELAHGDEIARLTHLIHSLPEDDQELIRLRYTAGLPFTQIAAILDSNENTVKKSLYRVMARLQSQLKDLHHG
jgi:RNA polymerase sigma-70 factor, ECF subfamily